MGKNHPRKRSGWRGLSLTKFAWQQKKRLLLLFAAHDTKQLRAAVRAHTLHGRAAVLHGHFLSVCHLFLSLALDAISFCHESLLDLRTLNGLKFSTNLIGFPRGRQGEKNASKPPI